MSILDRFPLQYLPNATKGIRDALRVAAESSQGIVTLSCGRFCSVGLDYAMCGSDVDKCVILADREGDFLTGLDKSLSSLGSSLASDWKVILKEQAEAELRACVKLPEYQEEYVLFHPFEDQSRKIEAQILLLRSVPHAIMLSRLSRDLQVYGKYECSERSRLIEGFLDKVEESGLASSKERKKQELRLRLFEVWDGLSVFEREIVIALKAFHDGTIISNHVWSRDVQGNDALEHLAGYGLARRLGREEIGESDRAWYYIMWTNGNSKVWTPKNWTISTARWWERRSADDLELG